MDEELRTRTLELLQDEQDQLKSAFEPQSPGINAPKTLEKVSIIQNSNGTYSKNVTEIESTFYDDSVVGIQEAKIKKDANTLQEFCKVVHDNIISFNTQINSKKEEIIELVVEAQGRNCWPGIAVSLSNPVSNTVGGPKDFGAPGYNLNQDRHVLEIYSSMTGPDANYSAENPFLPTDLKTLSSSNSGFGYEIIRDNGGLNSNSIEVERDDYSISGEDEDFDNDFLSSFENTVVIGTARTFSNIKIDHEPKIIAIGTVSYTYSGAGGIGIGTLGGGANDSSLTGDAAANRCVEISNKIDSLKQEIVALRSKRDASINLLDFNKIMKKKMEKELQNWGTGTIQQKQIDRESSNQSIINIVNNM